MSEKTVPLTVEQLQSSLARSTFIDAMTLTVVSADPATELVVMRLGMRPEFERVRGTGNGMAVPFPR